jgi:hypothetical protein
MCVCKKAAHTYRLQKLQFFTCDYNKLVCVFAKKTQFGFLAAEQKKVL